MITRLPPPGEVPPRQQAPPDREPVAVRWLPSMAPLGLAPHCRLGSQVIILVLIFSWRIRDWASGLELFVQMSCL